MARPCIFMSTPSHTRLVRPCSTGDRDGPAPGRSGRGIGRRICAPGSDERAADRSVRRRSIVAGRLAVVRRQKETEGPVWRGGIARRRKGAARPGLEGDSGMRDLLLARAGWRLLLATRFLRRSLPAVPRPRAPRKESCSSATSSGWIRRGKTGSRCVPSRQAGPDGVWRNSTLERSSCRRAGRAAAGWRWRSSPRSTPVGVAGCSTATSGAVSMCRRATPSTSCRRESRCRCGMARASAPGASQ